MHLILGSQSPRRRSLLAGLDIPFEAVDIHADEHFPADLQAGDIPLYISREKAQAYTSHLQADDLLITADTIVWLNGQMLGKPHDISDAKRMLHSLSGNTHQVYTGVTLTTTTQQESFVDCTDVTFRLLSDTEIDYYVEKYRPLDKAGAYGVQEYIGYIGVEKMVGSYFNVMGFPIDRVYLALRRYGCIPSAHI
ncbi:MAG: Maf family nucleotide pyrophosphatase [Paludibacteraceae bacterium]|nr:Maf family nucleotide pyrophosphatase [Bacteroidales bacterium]MDY4149785.1 Maf family nucleotide pyrophosphatase [Paludibacteraceae bacterium]